MMGLSRRDWIISGGGLGFLLILAVSFSVAMPAFWPYEIAGFGSAILFYCLFLFVPRCFNGFKPKPSKWKLANKISIFFSDKENQTHFFFCAFAVVLNLLFLVRFESGADYLMGVTKLVSDFMAPWQVGISAIMVCWWTAALLVIVVAQFNRSEMMITIEKWVAGLLFVFIAFMMPLEIEGVCGNVMVDGFNFRGLLMALEFGLGAAFILFDWMKNPSPKLNRSLAYAIIVMVVLILMTSIWDYLPQNLFGTMVQNIPSPKKFSLSHRLIIGLCFVVPFVYFLLLYPFDEKHRRTFLIFIAANILFAYTSWPGGVGPRYEMWTHFYSWPLHLCNTAMYIMPVCLIFMWVGLFYFTMFINVLGAFLAITMPNYSSSITIFDPRIFQFYNNHIYAFMMPVLVILLAIFERPKWKYFGYSMIGFTVYFVFVGFLNTYYNATNLVGGVAVARHSTDFFFIGSDYVASKVADHGGKWAESLFNLNTQWTDSAGYTYTLRIPYLASYFIVYVALALGMWYIYEMLFAATDQLIMLHERSRQYRVSEIQFRKAEQQRRSTMEDKIDTVDHSPRLTISHFTKRYGTAKVNAVTDFSLDIAGGKIYGFLGKNGAGKSTIIKAIVGMHGFNDGTITVCGYDVEHQPVQAKQEIGFVPDNYALYESLTGRQYINYMADLYGVTNSERAERLPGLLKRLEMESHFDDQMKTYSHGMKQKITIIGALIHNPKIWILDEPMTGVDPNSIFQIKECMREHAENGNIVFFSSHLIDVVQNLCDEIIMIKHGQLVLTSSMDDLKAKGIDLEALFLEKTADSEEEAKALIQEESKFDKK
jgi:ABC-2 type transport system ATP-binding protein